MKRRTFLAGIGTAVIWPRAVGAQQANRARKIGVLLNFRRDDPEGQAQISAFSAAHFTANFEAEGPPSG